MRYVDFSVGFNIKIPKFKVGTHEQICNYKSIFSKSYKPNYNEEVFAIKKVQNKVPTSCTIFKKTNMWILRKVLQADKWNDRPEFKCYWCKAGPN